MRSRSSKDAPDREGEFAGRAFAPMGRSIAVRDLFLRVRPMPIPPCRCWNRRRLRLREGDAERQEGRDDPFCFVACVLCGGFPLIYVGDWA